MFPVTLFSPKKSGSCQKNWNCRESCLPCWGLKKEMCLTCLFFAVHEKWKKNTTLRHLSTEPPIYQSEGRWISMRFAGFQEEHPGFCKKREKGMNCRSIVSCCSWICFKIFFTENIQFDSLICWNLVGDHAKEKL